MRHRFPAVFRGFTAAASLKVDCTGHPQSQTSMRFPRFHRRGLIEGRRLTARRPTQQNGFPRFHRRGLIEGCSAFLIRMVVSIVSFPRFHRRGLIEGWTLRQPMQSVVPSFPRFHRRGLIEGWQALPITIGGACFPRFHRRGLIEGIQHPRS